MVFPDLQCFSSWNSEHWRCLDVLILLYHKPWRKYLEVIGILIIWRTCIACIINGTVFGSIQHIQFSLGIPKTRDVMSWTVSSTEFWSLRTWSMSLVGHGNLFETIFNKDPQIPKCFFSKSFRLTVTDIKEKLMKIQIFGTPHHSQTLPFDWRWHYSRPRPKPVRCLDLTQLKRITRTQVDHIPRRDGMGILYYTFPSWIWPLFHLHCIRK